jgi:threonine synthase
MIFTSTRGHAAPVPLRALLTRGTAPDGGLYMPQNFPAPDLQRALALGALPFADLVAALIALFDDRPEAGSATRAAIARAYARFSTAGAPPVTALTERCHALELFHGPTLAFKDYALMPLAELISEEMRRSGGEATILCATSGDTGAATAAAFAGRPGLRAAILFPQGRVSPVQQRQITTTGAANIAALRIAGDFDRCQALVKRLYASPEARQDGFTAVNSINFVRILIQTGYYLATACRLWQSRAEPVNFFVPTGNFGNVLAGHFARMLGAPIGRLVVCSNENDVLPRLFETGQMLRQPTQATLSPSMDIQVSSNFERMLHLLARGDCDRVNSLQRELELGGSYSLAPAELAELRAGFAAFCAPRSMALSAMSEIWQRYRRIICPHGATAWAAALTLDLPGTSVIVETAHPAKFPEAFETSGLPEPVEPGRLARLKGRAEHCIDAPADAARLRALIASVPYGAAMPVA